MVKYSSTYQTWTMNDEQTMLEEVATWKTSSELDFQLTKCVKIGFYTCQLHSDEGGMRVVMELLPAEATIFNRHLTFPATRADLDALPQRLRVAKLRALIS